MSELATIFLDAPIPQIEDFDFTIYWPICGTPDKPRVRPDFALRTGQCYPSVRFTRKSYGTHPALDEALQVAYGREITHEGYLIPARIPRVASTLDGQEIEPLITRPDRTGKVRYPSILINRGLTLLDEIGVQKPPRKPAPLERPVHWEVREQPFDLEMSDWIRNPTKDVVCHRENGSEKIMDPRTFLIKTRAIEKEEHRSLRSWAQSQKRNKTKDPNYARFTKKRLGQSYVPDTSGKEDRHEDAEAPHVSAHREGKISWDAEGHPAVRLLPNGTVYNPTDSVNVKSQDFLGDPSPPILVVPITPFTDGVFIREGAFELSMNDRPTFSEKYPFPFADMRTPTKWDRGKKPSNRFRTYNPRRLRCANCGKRKYCTSRSCGGVSLSKAAAQIKADELVGLFPSSSDRIDTLRETTQAPRNPRREVEWITDGVRLLKMFSLLTPTQIEAANIYVERLLTGATSEEAAAKYGKSAVDIRKAEEELRAKLPQLEEEIWNEAADRLASPRPDGLYAFVKKIRQPPRLCFVMSESEGQAFIGGAASSKVTGDFRLFRVFDFQIKAFVGTGALNEGQLVRVRMLHFSENDVRLVDTAV